MIAQRLYLVTLDKMAYNETTFMLLFPIWWAYGASLFAAVVAAVVAVYMPLARLTGSLPDPGEVDL